jgi:hypothetical protein
MTVTAPGALRAALMLRHRDPARANSVWLPGRSRWQRGYVPGCCSIIPAGQPGRRRLAGGGYPGRLARRARLVSGPDRVSWSSPGGAGAEVAGDHEGGQPGLSWPEFLPCSGEL